MNVRPFILILEMQAYLSIAVTEIVFQLSLLSRECKKKKKKRKRRGRLNLRHVQLIA